MTKALILTGGKSSRMGKDKYLLEIHGKPQYQYLYELVEKMKLPVHLSCTEEQGARIPARYQRIVDKYDSIGPIGGIASAIEMNDQTSWLVIACDLVNLQASMVTNLFARANGDADVVTYQKAGATYYETTLAIYKPSSFPVISQAVASGAYGLQKVLKRCNVLTLTPENEDWLKNVNFPGEL